MRTAASNLLCATGVALVVYGIASIYPPAAYIAGGAFAFVAAINLIRGK